MIIKSLFPRPLQGLILASLLFLSACGSDSGESRVEQGNREGVLHFGNGTELQGLDPHVVTGVPEHHVINALFEGLVTKNPETLEIEPGVAESWDISEDGRFYTFHLRQDAQWSNGDPVTAEDFRWSWQRALTPALGSEYAYMYFPVKNAEAFATGALTDFNEVGARVIDDYTFEVELNEPTPYFLQLLDHYSMFPVHRATVEAFGSPSNRNSQWAQEGNLVGNGAFNLADWRINSHVRVEKSQTYWDAANIRLNAIVFYPTENIVTEERMYRNGQLHRTQEIPIDKIPLYLEERPDEVRIEPWLGSYFYMLNTTKPPLDDVRVRRALVMAIDRELLINSVLGGVMLPSFALVPPDTLGYYPPKTFDYDPEQARALLAEAGYPDGEGFPQIDILYNTQEDHRKVAVAIQQMWAKTLGISAVPYNQEWKVYLESQNSMNYTVSRRGWIGDYVDPNNFLDLYLTGGGNNNTGFADERYDEIILEDAPRAETREERYKLFQEAETILMEYMPIIPIYIYSTKSLIHPSVKGVPSNIMDYYNWKYVYLEPVAE